MTLWSAQFPSASALCFTPSLGEPSANDMQFILETTNVPAVQIAPGTGGISQLFGGDSLDSAPIVMASSDTTKLQATGERIATKFTACEPTCPPRASRSRLFICQGTHLRASRTHRHLRDVERAHRGSRLCVLSRIRPNENLSVFRVVISLSTFCGVVLVMLRTLVRLCAS